MKDAVGGRALTKHALGSRPIIKRSSATERSLNRTCLSLRSGQVARERREHHSFYWTTTGIRARGTQISKSTCGRQHRDRVLLRQIPSLRIEQGGKRQVGKRGMRNDNESLRSIE